MHFKWIAIYSKALLNNNPERLCIISSRCDSRLSLKGKCFSGSWSILRQIFVIFSSTMTWEEMLLEVAKLHLWREPGRHAVNIHYTHTSVPSAPSHTQFEDTIWDHLIWELPEDTIWDHLIYRKVISLR